MIWTIKMAETLITFLVIGPVIISICLLFAHWKKLQEVNRIGGCALCLSGPSLLGLFCLTKLLDRALLPELTHSVWHSKSLSFIYAWIMALLSTHWIGGGSVAFREHILVLVRGEKKQDTTVRRVRPRLLSIIFQWKQVQGTLSSAIRC